ncbi:hypothetical protein [Acinetobacter brisouii]
MANRSKPFVTDWENPVPVSGAVLAALTLILVLVQKRLYQHDNPAACQAAA